MYDYIGSLKVFPDSQDLLVEVQHQRHQGVGQAKGHAQGLIFWESLERKLLSFMHNPLHSRFAYEKYALFPCYVTHL